MNQEREKRTVDEHQCRTAKKAIFGGIGGFLAIQTDSYEEMENLLDNRIMNRWKKHIDGPETFADLRKASLAVLKELIEIMEGR